MAFKLRDYSLFLCYNNLSSGGFMERRVFIVNPVSGKGKSVEIVKFLEEKCKHDNIDYCTMYTNNKNDATNYARDLTLPTDIIYSIGGDGTLNEIVSGIVGLDRRLCIVPAGSGNDFYKSVMEDSVTGKVDLGYVNDKYFINSFSIGIDADICENSNLFRKKYIPSSMIYDLSILYTLMSYKSKNMTIDSINQDCTLISITNGKYYGGGFKINPNATLNDGFLDMIIAEKISKPEIVCLLMKLLKGTHQYQDCISTSKIKELKIYSSVELLTCIDGEMFKSNDFNIGIIPEAIELYNDEEVNIKKLLKK